jgi:hypothetical protein
MITEFSSNSGRLEVENQASGAHVSFEQLDPSNFDKTVAFYQQLNLDTLIIGWDERAWHPEGIKQVVKCLVFALLS